MDYGDPMETIKWQTRLFGRRSKTRIHGLSYGL